MGVRSPLQNSQKLYQEASKIRFFKFFFHAMDRKGVYCLVDIIMTNKLSREYAIYFA